MFRTEHGIKYIKVKNLTVTAFKSMCRSYGMPNLTVIFREGLFSVLNICMGAEQTPVIEDDGDRRATIKTKVHLAS